MKIIMKRLIISVLIVLSLSSCSTMLIQEELYEEQEVESPRGNLEMRTKSGEVIDDDAILAECGIIQKSRISILLNHVYYKEGTYVQALTVADMESLGLKEEEITFCDNYVKALNQSTNEKD